jgi:succinate-semialdehyde dehydrogenase / glutarate-semialdehyde dehydrogenase
VWKNNAVTNQIETRAMIGGAFIATPKTFAVTNPYSGQVVAEVADCDIQHAHTALEKSVAAFAWWSKTTAYERATLLKKFYALMLREEQELAKTIALEMGKPVTEALGEVRYAAGFVEWYAEEAKRVYGQTIPSQFAHKRLFAISQPVGAVYAVTPWNFPAAMVGLHNCLKTRRAVALNRYSIGTTLARGRRSR